MNALRPMVLLGLRLVDAAHAQFNAYALTTDRPAWGAVEAADWLDAMRGKLVLMLGGGE